MPAARDLRGLPVTFFSARFLRKRYRWLRVEQRPAMGRMDFLVAGSSAGFRPLVVPQLSKDPRKQAGLEPSFCRTAFESPKSRSHPDLSAAVSREIHGASSSGSVRNKVWRICFSRRNLFRARFRPRSDWCRTLSVEQGKSLAASGKKAASCLWVSTLSVRQGTCRTFPRQILSSCRT